MGDGTRQGGSAARPRPGPASKQGGPGQVLHARVKLSSLWVRKHWESDLVSVIHVF